MEDPPLTTPSKIHRQDPEQNRGVAVCGRKAEPDRMTDDPRVVTCGVCLTWQTEASGRSAPSPASAATTVIDRLVDVVAASSGRGATSDQVARARGRAKARAHHRLAARHPDEFRDIFRDELEAAMAEVEEFEILALDGT